jgi:outer membrane protein assembly factor BamB
VRCISQQTGGTVWTYKPETSELGPSYSTAVIEGNVAYLGSINGHVVGHDVDTGAKVFDVDVRPEKKDDLFDSIPALRDGRLYVGSVGGNVYCVNIADESVEWAVALQPGFIFTGPALWKDKVLVGSLNDMVYEITYRQ